MEEFDELREDWLRRWLKLPNGVSCANTLSRVFQAIEPTAFAACIAEHLARLGFTMENVSNPTTEKQPRDPAEGDQQRRTGFRRRSDRFGFMTHLNDLIHADSRKRGITGFSDHGGKRR